MSEQQAGEAWPGISVFFPAYNSKLGWYPRVSLEEGLRHTLAYYEQHGQHYWDL
jgi:dTDP-D-glucose 4,6-dehydratase